MKNISLKLKHRRSANKDKAMPVYVQIIYKRKVGVYLLRQKLLADEWDGRNGCMQFAAAGNPERLRELLGIQEQLEKEIGRIWKVIRQMEGKEDFSIPLLLATLREQDESRTWKNYLEKLIAYHQGNGQVATARHYRSTLNILLLFLKGNDLPLCETNSPLLRQFEEWMIQRGLSPNTISFYFRYLRSAWNKAVREGLQEYVPELFAEVNTSIGKTAKRAVEEKVIERLSALTVGKDLSPEQAFARDLFLFCYYARGMAFIDLAYLTPENIQGDKLVYTRKKTGQELKITLLPVMKEMIKRYRNNGTPYLFPILTNGDSYKDYESSIRVQNKRLKKAGHKIGIDNLTTYVARHSWASIALQKGVPVEVISESLGHSSVKVTRIYIALLDNPWLDYANEIVVLNKKNKHVNGVRKGAPFWAKSSVSW